MAPEVGFKIVDAESGMSWSNVLNKSVRNINHKHSKVSRIVNRELFKVHKIFQTPELFGITEIEFNLEPEAVIVNSANSRVRLANSTLLVVVRTRAFYYMAPAVGQL